MSPEIKEEVRVEHLTLPACSVLKVLDLADYKSSHIINCENRDCCQCSYFLACAVVCSIQVLTQFCPVTYYFI